ncbi:nucleolar protein 16 [Alosa pseudoharengus]|uniref:nucleolar protein 16 n=1 Tax=Alosa sapidissima TaxID=34773 RepID=UPI001C086F6D|nr:nucleolar protein 16 [Alosa sapidissima]
MPKAKKSSKRKKFDYTKDRKKLRTKLRRKLAPTIECAQIRNAWDDRKTVQQNLREMGLQHDTKTVLPIRQPKLTNTEAMDVEPDELLIKKPYVIKDMEAQASIPSQSSKTLSRDLIEYAQHMLREHGDGNYKAMARDEKNYYQDTPKQIKRKIEDYKQCHAEDYSTFMQSLKA